MQNYVFVIDQNKQALNPIPPARARELLTKQKAAVFRMYPFTIILKHVVGNPSPKPLIIKLDPGSKFTGIAILDGENVIWAARWEHRAWQIKMLWNLDDYCAVVVVIVRLGIVNPVLITVNVLLDGYLHR
jgi:hypothetical protein